MAWVYTVPQLWWIISGKTGGLTLAMYVIFMTYIVFSALLAIASYKKSPNIVRRQTIIIFIQWSVLVGAIIFAGLGKIVWRSGDTAICIVIAALSALTVLRYRGLDDPYSKSFIAVWCKAIPQLWLAYTMVSVGRADGLPLITLIAGHLTALPRLAQVVIGGKTGGWDKPTKGLILSEAANVVTWGAVTVVWLLL